MSNKNFKSINSAKSSRRTSIGELKTAIKQYESKLKFLEIKRTSRSPPSIRDNSICSSNTKTKTKKKIHGKSYSLVCDDSKNNTKISQDISSTKLDFIVRNPDYSSKESEIKCLKAEIFALQQKLNIITKEHEFEMKKIKESIETEKNTEIETITKFYIEKLNECEESFNLKLNECEESFNLKLNERLEQEAEKIRNECEMEYTQRIKEAIKEKQQEYEFIQEQFLHRIKYKENSRSFESKSFNLPSYLEKNDDQEEKYKSLLQEKSNEYERKINNYIQDLQNLRKENNSLKQKIMEIQAKYEAGMKIGGDKDSDSSYIISLNKRYNDLLENYNDLKTRQEKFGKNPVNENYCSKCRAFVEQNSELSKKILRLREFLLE
ncbi:hypothetical protein SteCoe_28247 [Stentor coeruleus]|uniref:Uncharacterized protein n=1 Tax=Stentor coeruleus TaxID=5963 RepID=A0A1R2B8M3_9CILI|nr:hypothetical protein SteCoe_28247 [Stentor coeruleus]